MEAATLIKSPRRLVVAINLQEGKAPATATTLRDGGRHQPVANAAPTIAGVDADVGDEPGVRLRPVAGEERDVSHQTSLFHPDVALAHPLHDVAHAGQDGQAAAAQQTHVAHRLTSGAVHAGAEDQLDEVGQFAEVAAQVNRAQSVGAAAAGRGNRGHALLHLTERRPV